MILPLLLMVGLLPVGSVGCGSSGDAAGDNSAETSPAMFPAFEGGLWGYIDKTGAWVIKPTYNWAGSFSEGLAVVQPGKEAKYGYIDTSGKIVIKSEYSYGWLFSNGLAPVMPGMDGKYGYIDASGKMVIGPRNDENAMGFSDNGLASVSVGGKYRLHRQDRGLRPRAAIHARVGLLRRACARAKGRG